MKITTATKITIARIVLIVPTVILYVLGVVFATNNGAYIGLMVSSCVLYAVLCSTDFVDGAVARKTNTVSDLGKFLDPLADKVVIVVMLFLVVYHGAGLGIFAYNGLIIALLGGLILSRELMISVFRSLAAKKGTVLAADVYGKIKTWLLDIGVGFLIIAGLHEVIAWLGTIVFYLGGIMTVVSGVNYIVKNKQVFSDDVEDKQVESNDCEERASRLSGSADNVPESETK